MAAPSQLSFLPDDYLERKVQRRTNFICAFLFICVIAGVSATFMTMRKNAKRTEAAFKKVEDDYVGAARLIEQVKTMQDNHKRMAHQAELTRSLLERVPRSYILAELTNALPKGLSMVDFTLESKPRVRAVVNAAKAELTDYEKKKAAKEKAKTEAQQASTEPKQYDVFMKLTGVAPSNVEVAQFLNKLNKCEAFKDVNLVITEEHTVGDDKVRRFQLELTLSPSFEPKGEARKSLDGAKETLVELK